MHEQLEATIVYVTHDQIEAMTLGDRIAVMKSGEVHQLASPQEVYDDPADLFVAGFIGSPPMNLIRANVEDHNAQLGVKLRHDNEAFFFQAPDSIQDSLSKSVGQEVIVGIRPEQISDEISRGDARDDRVRHRVRVDVVHPTGPDTLILIELNDTPVTCRIHPETRVRSGETTELVFDLSKLVFFDPDTEKRIR